jgi:hypothetical protein
MREIEVIKRPPVFEQFNIAKKETVKLLPEYDAEQTKLSDKTKDAFLGDDER